MGGPDFDSGYSIAVDDSGNVYTTGSFLGTADFDPGPGTSNLTGGGNWDVFISKLDSAGNFLWAKNVDGANFVEGFSIALDGSGNVYTTGRFGDTGDFDPGAGTSYLTSAGVWDVFILKLDAAGNFLWAKSMGGSDSEWGNSIELDDLSNIYITGFFSGTADFDPGAGTAI